MIYGLSKIIVMEMLSKESLSGYDLINAFGKHIGKKPSPGSIYPTLKELHKQKLISVREDGRRKIYSLTREGHAILKGILKNKKEISDRISNIRNIIYGISKEKLPSLNEELCEEIPELKIFMVKLFNIMNSKDEIKKEKLRFLLKKTISEMPK